MAQRKKGLTEKQKDIVLSAADIVFTLRETRCSDEKPSYYSKSQLEGLIKDNLADPKLFKVPSSESYKMLTDHSLIGEKENKFRHLYVSEKKIDSYQQLYTMFSENHSDFFGRLKNVKRRRTVDKTMKVVKQYIKSLSDSKKTKNATNDIEGSILQIKEDPYQNAASKSMKKSLVKNTKKTPQLKDGKCSKSKKKSTALKTTKKPPMIKESRGTKSKKKCTSLKTVTK